MSDSPTETSSTTPRSELCGSWQWEINNQLGDPEMYPQSDDPTRQAEWEKQWGMVSDISLFS